MMIDRDKWVEKAFEKAEKDVNKVHITAVRIRKFLDENTEAILDKWSQMVGENTSVRVANLLAIDEELCDAIETMNETFFTAGVLYEKMRHGNKR